MPRSMSITPTTATTMPTDQRMGILAMNPISIRTTPRMIIDAPFLEGVLALPQLFRCKTLVGARRDCPRMGGGVQIDHEHHLRSPTRIAVMRSNEIWREGRPMERSTPER